MLVLMMGAVTVAFVGLVCLFVGMVVVRLVKAKGPSPK